jgi:NIMA (never in mitosis gene a)-related kinase
MQAIKGSPLYLAPEIAKGQEYDFSSDIWSFGIMIFELVTQ